MEMVDPIEGGDEAQAVGRAMSAVQPAGVGPDLGGPVGSTRQPGPADEVAQFTAELAEKVGEAHGMIDNELHAMAAKANEMHTAIDEQAMMIRSAVKRNRLAEAQAGSKVAGGEDSVGFAFS
jgi:hypothetical protein